MDWLILVIVVVCLLLLKFLLNLVRLLQLKRYLTEYKEWFDSPNESFLESKAQVIKLLQDAGVEDSNIPVIEPAGYGYLRTITPSVFANFPHARTEHVQVMHVKFREAIGVYRNRMWQTFNPLYWIEFIIYLPRVLLSYLGVPAEGTKIKVLQLAWWIVGAVSTVALALYAAEIRTFIEGLLLR